MDWHDKTCTRLDLTAFGDGTSCLSCGSFGPALVLARPLIRQLSEIRILRILPGEFDDVIECEAFSQSLSSHPEYDAISYTWADESGDASKCSTIIVSGKPFEVTRNCEMALRRVRMKFFSRQVWIDAICIDQENIDERGHQVRLMPRIYSGAKSVLIYVGESTPDSTILFRSLSHSESHLEIYGQHRGKWTELFSRRYFNRIWILQEVALSRKATLICGQDSITWPILQASQIKESLAQIRSFPPVFHFDYKTYASPDQFLNLLDLARQCESTDPRDKVFALLGLLPAGRVGQIEADYTLTFERIYTRVALELKDIFGWGAVMTRAGLQRQLRARSDEPLNIGQESSLPSWVPDWRVTSLKEKEQDIVQSSEQSMASPWISSIEYNEKEESIALTLLEVPGSGSRWNAWDSNISSLSSRYICIQENGLLHHIAQSGYRYFRDSFSFASSRLWDGPNIPYGSFSNWSLDLQLMEHSTSKHLLLEFNESSRKVPWGCFSLAAAVQIFTLPVCMMELLSIIQAIESEQDDIYFLGSKPFKVDHDDEISYTKVMETDVSSWPIPNTTIAKIERMGNRLPAVAEDVESYWARKWARSELENVAHSDLEPGSKTSAFVFANEALWKLLVRSFLIRETKVKLV